MKENNFYLNVLPSRHFKKASARLKVDLNTIYKPRLSSSLVVNLPQHISTYPMQTTSFIILYHIAGTAFAIRLCNILRRLSV